MKRLSFPSNNLNVNNEDLLKVKDEYFETMSTKSIESQQTVNSKISFISSQSSNRSSYAWTDGTGNNNGGHGHGQLMADQDEKKIKQMKFENAKIHLNIEQLKLEKLYYEQILKSVEDIVINKNENNDKYQLDQNGYQCNSLIEQIQHVLSLSVVN
eukprot:CAMPEP_0201578524 /NCGR_PEP_ID=MMETSP0190_2-20130828/25426_1 /ASSEMBLY_ACC=CAM_ASM_000263 /TAXON_ID=37353 /ORGANISM="Rosalina sp." /LENGTH=155 /DNA_ID=CAMNT_0048011799 /DNA_START=368 /DNA_END=835 /DNA_ORIENTATION=+